MFLGKLALWVGVAGTVNRYSEFVNPLVGSPTAWGVRPDHVRFADSGGTYVVGNGAHFGLHSSVSRVSAEYGGHLVFTTATFFGALDWVTSRPGHVTFAISGCHTQHRVSGAGAVYGGHMGLQGRMSGASAVYGGHLRLHGGILGCTAASQVPVIRGVFELRRAWRSRSPGT